MFRFSLVLFLLVVAMPTNTIAASNTSQLLRECNQHLNANRLTSGKGGTALSCYQEVLQLEPKNAKALAGLNKIEARYVKWAKRALEKNQKDKTKQYLSSLRMVNPQSIALVELEAQLQPPSKVTSTPVAPVAPITPKSLAESIEPLPDDTSSEPTKSAVLQPPTDESATPSSTSEEPLPSSKKAQITDIEQIYELINTTECLVWPTPEAKVRGGKNGWKKFYPKKGDTGIIIKEMQHCHLEDNVYIVKLEQYYVPISSIGVKIMDETSISADVIESVDKKSVSNEKK